MPTRWMLPTCLQKQSLVVLVSPLTHSGLLVAVAFSGMDGVVRTAILGADRVC